MREEAAVDRLIALMARLPGLGPRSARRAVLALVRRRELLLEPLAAAMAEVAATVRECPACGNIATGEVCTVCADPVRATGEICVVETVADLGHGGRVDRDCQAVLRQGNLDPAGTLGLGPGAVEEISVGGMGRRRHRQAQRQQRQDRNGPEGVAAARPESVGHLVCSP